MKTRQWILLCAATALLSVWSAAAVGAATVSGRASTVLEWFDTGGEETAVPLYQYLLLNVRDIDGDGLNFRGYGRVAGDLQDEADIDSRLYYAYLEKRGIVKNLDFKLGRQFIATTAGASMMDGLALKYHDLGPCTLSLYGGGDVTYYEGYEAQNLLFGAEVGLSSPDRYSFKFSYLQKYDDSDLSHELFGLDAYYNIKDIANLYGEVQFNYLTDCISYLLAGGQYYRNPAWTLRGEYLYSLPVFSSTSIYSVFAVDEYRELTGEFDYKLKPGLKAYGRLTRELYDEFEDATVFEAGLEKIRTDRFSGYLSGIIRADGDGQDLRGIKLRGAYLLNDKVQAGCGVHLDVMERRLDDTDDETTSSRIWLDVTTFITRKVSLQGKIERVESDLWDEYYRGRIRLNISF